MRTASTGEGGVVSSDTEFVFEQTADVVSARYRGGAIIDGYLVGRLSGARIHFRYVQIDVDGRVDAGVSDGHFERLPDGRLRLTERFQWVTRPEHGTNIFEEPAKGQPRPDRPITVGQGDAAAGCSGSEGSETE
jgi:hypothetical protein